MFRYVIIIILLGLTSAIARIAPQDEEQSKQAYETAYNEILDENWTRAIEQLEKVITKFPYSRWVDDARFWQCYAREKMGQDPETVFKCYQDFIQTHSESNWAGEAKTNMIVLGKKLEEQGKVKYKALIAAMEKSQNDEIMESAISALQMMGNEASLQTLLELYESTDNLVMKDKIIFALSNSDNPRAEEKLIEIVTDDDSPEARKKALYWLGTRAESEDVIIVLENIAMNESDAEIREKAIFAISQAPAKYSIPFLERLATEPEQAETRAKAVFWLSQTDGSEHVQKLLEDIIARDPDPEVREKAVFAISEMSDELAMPALVRLVKNSKDPEVREKAIFWLGQNARTGEIISVLEDVVNNESSQNLREQAIFAISQAPSELSEPALIKLGRGHPVREVRKKAVFWLGQEAKSQKVVDVLIDIAENDPDSELREHAVMAVSQLPRQMAMPALGSLIADSKRPEVRRKALFWLGHNQPSDATINLLEQIINNDPDEEMRENALYALSQAPDNKGVPVLIKVAKSHSDYRLRKKAIFWLGESKDPRAREALLDILKDQNN